MGIFASASVLMIVEKWLTPKMLGVGDTLIRNLIAISVLISNEIKSPKTYTLSVKKKSAKEKVGLIFSRTKKSRLKKKSVEID